jgi:cytochrome c oxidase subunit II
MIQDTAWLLSLVLMGLVVLVFAVVCAGAGTPGSVAKPYRGRSVFVWIALAAGVVIAFVTLTPWPMAAYAARGSGAAPAATVKVVGHQWRWELSATEVPVGKPVEFLLTAVDVNHGFGIYKAKQRLIAQVQAMPGFTNKLLVTFDEPGEYELLCMEYCGAAHHRMVATITAR